MTDEINEKESKPNNDSSKDETYENFIKEINIFLKFLLCS